MTLKLIREEIADRNWSEALKALDSVPNTDRLLDVHVEWPNHTLFRRRGRLIQITAQDDTGVNFNSGIREGNETGFTSAFNALATFMRRVAPR